MTTATIRTPIYLPWIPFMKQLEKSDYYVIADETQFNKKETFSTKNYIDYHGSKLLLSVPINHVGISGQRQIFSEVKIDNSHKWAEKHFKNIQHAYSFTSYFKQYKEEIKKLLIELLHKLLIFLMREMNINTKIIKQSELEMNPNLNGEEMLIDICKKIKVDNYICGSKEATFIDEKPFQKESIKVIYLPKFNNQEYEQFNNSLSSIDTLFKIGPEEIRKFIKNNCFKTL